MRLFVLSMCIVSACSQTCGTWSKTEWSGFNNQNSAGAALRRIQCNSGCIVSQIVTEYGGNVDSIKLVCSDESTVGPLGCKSCRSDSSASASNPTGFTGMQVWAGGNVSGLLALNAGSSSYSWIGGSCRTACQNTYVLNCDSGELLIGVEVWLGGNATILNAIQILCGSVSCSGGTYFFQGLCYACEPGTYSLAGNVNCNACPAGRYSGSESSSCIQCPAGTYSQQGSASCTSCSAGQYSLNESSGCTNCSAGSFSSPPGTAPSIPRNAAIFLETIWVSGHAARCAQS